LNGGPSERDARTPRWHGVRHATRLCRCDGAAGSGAGAASSCLLSGPGDVASVIGGAAGLLLGGALGASLERAAYGGNPDAGLTGGLVGAVVGGVAGAGLARKACDQSSESQLRAHLSPMRELGPLGVRIHRGESEHLLPRPVPELPLTPRARHELRQRRRVARRLADHAKRAVDVMCGS
jgi:hypothetical protein